MTTRLTLNTAADLKPVVLRKALVTTSAAAMLMALGAAPMAQAQIVITDGQTTTLTTGRTRRDGRTICIYILSRARDSEQPSFGKGFT